MGAVLLLAAAACVAASDLSPAVADGLEVEVIPSAAAPGSGGIPFLFTGEPVPVKVLWKTEQPLPPETRLLFQVVDYRGNVLSEKTFQPALAGQSGIVYRIVRIPPEPTARCVRLRVRLGNMEKVTAPLWTIVRDPEPVPMVGWYPPEKAADGTLIWWSKGRSEVRIPLAPAGQSRIFRCRGSAPLDCIDGHRFTLRLMMGDYTLNSWLISKESFEIWMLISDGSEIAGSDMLLTFKSDKTFTPAHCAKGSKDVRTLAFNISEFELAEMMPVEGFDLGRVPGGGRQIRPEAKARLPVPREPSELWFQGKLNHSCLPGERRIRIILGKRVIYDRFVGAKDMCARIPLKSEWIPHDMTVCDVSIKVEPFYFPSACGESEDDRPHGMIVEELFIAPVTPSK